MTARLDSHVTFFGAPATPRLDKGCPKFLETCQEHLLPVS